MSKNIWKASLLLIFFILLVPSFSHAQETNDIPDKSNPPVIVRKDNFISPRPPEGDPGGNFSNNIIHPSVQPTDSQTEVTVHAGSTVLPVVKLTPVNELPISSGPSPSCSPRPPCLDGRRACAMAEINSCPEPTEDFPPAYIFPTCGPPPCLFSNPHCEIVEPADGWCHDKGPIPSLLPIPSPTPTEIKEPPSQSGTVDMTATLWMCSTRPYEGDFSLCESNFPTDIFINSIFGRVNICNSLHTDSKGHGSLTLSSGNYSVYPPSSPILFCGPGKFCITDIVPDIVNHFNPISWTITPSYFFLGMGQNIEVTAAGQNNLLKCPVFIP